MPDLASATGFAHACLCDVHGLWGLKAQGSGPSRGYDMVLADTPIGHCDRLNIHLVVLCLAGYMYNSIDNIGEACCAGL